MSQALRMFTRRALARSLLAVAPLCSAGAYADTVSWQAASGLYPDEPPGVFRLVDDASPEQPQWGAGFLTLGSNLLAETLYYQHDGAGLQMPPVLVIDFGVRVTASASISDSRAAAGVGFTTLPRVGGALYLDTDRAFLLTADGERGATAAVDNTAFHDWRIVVSGVANGSLVQVYRDGGLLLSGSTFSDTSVVGTVPRVNFGELSIRASGSSDWTYLTHNAGAALPVPEPTPLALGLAGGLLLWRMRRRAVVAAALGLASAGGALAQASKPAGVDFAELLQAVSLPAKATAAPSWNQFDIPGIQWKTPGPVQAPRAYAPMGPLYREGRLVLMQGGQPAYVDGRKRVGTWLITLHGQARGVVEVKLGTETISESPGPSIEAMEKAGFKLRKRCQESMGAASEKAVWQVAVPGRSPLLLGSESNSGNAGTSLWFSVPYTAPRVAATNCTF